jgi:hypothetical protein
MRVCSAHDKIRSEVVTEMFEADVTDIQQYDSYKIVV